MANEKDPICGHCGNPLSKHYHEDRVYCNDFTNGDTFDEAPADDLLVAFIEEKHGDLYKQFIEEWKTENGHIVPQPTEEGKHG